MNRGNEEEEEGEGERGRTTWCGGGLAEDDGVLSLVAAVEVGVGYGREKKRLSRREKGWKEKREKVMIVALPLVRSWVDGNDGGKAGCGNEGQWKRKQKKKKTGGAAERREKPTVAHGGRLAVVLASCGGADGGKTSDESSGG